MNYRQFGRTGIRVAPMAIGTLNFGFPTGPEEVAQIINRALDAGLNLIDTANFYNNGESEITIGKALAASGRRHQAILATKVYFPMGSGANDRGNSRKHILHACEQSLRRLQTDYLDLYQIHRPDPTTPIEETLSALTDLVRQGKVRYVGCSTHPAWQVMEALLVSELRGFVRYASEQPPYNLLDRRIEHELVPLALKHGLALIPWAPMAQGVLAGRYQDVQAPPADSRVRQRGSYYADRVTADGIAVAGRFALLAEEAGLSSAQLALLWCKDQPGITAPIYGVRTLAQLEHMLPVVDMTLSEELRALSDALVPPGATVVNFHNTAGWVL